MTSVYDMSDVLGGTHNKLSPMWQMNMRLLLGFLYCAIIFLVYMLVVSRIRIKKWKAEGIYDYEHNCRMSDEEIAAKRAAEAAAAQQTTAVEETVIEETSVVVEETVENAEEIIADTMEDKAEETTEAEKTDVE